MDYQSHDRSLLASDLVALIQDTVNRANNNKEWAVSTFNKCFESIPSKLDTTRAAIATELLRITLNGGFAKSDVDSIISSFNFIYDGLNKAAGLGEAL